MEGERDEQEEVTHSQVENDEPQECRDPEEKEKGNGASDGQEAVVAVMASDMHNNPDCLPASPLPAEEQLITSAHPSCTHDGPPEPCWYCLRTQESGSRPETGQQDPDLVSLLPSGGKRLNYQTDPRPHFGVAWSSHSTCRPLWGSEGPCWGQRNQEASDQTHTCPHCHLGMDSDALRWHEAKCLLFDGLRNSK